MNLNKNKSWSVAFFLVFSLVKFCIAGSSKTDSLENLLKGKLHDTIRVNVLNDLSRAYLQKDRTLTKSYAQQALKLAQESRFRKGEANALNNLGVIDWQEGEYDRGKKEIENAMQIFQSMNDRNGVAKCLGNIGLIYRAEGDFPSALRFQFRSLKVREEMKDEDGMAKNYSAIGNIYDSEHNGDLAIENHQKAMQLWKKLGNEFGVATSLINIGNIYWDQHKDTAAFEHYKEALAISEKLNNIVGQSTCYMNLAMLYDKWGDTEKALNFYREALKSKESLNDQSGISICYLSIGTTLMHQKKYKEGIEAVNKGLEICRKINRKEGIRNAYSILATSYAEQGDYKQAFHYQDLYGKIKDTLLNEASMKDMMELQQKYESDKKQKEIALLTKDSEIKALQLNKSKLWMIVLFGAVLLAIMIALLLFNRNKLKQRANEMLEHRNVEITQQKKEITDSINYAKRIQESILPPTEHWQRILPHSFIFYRPKDIVSGDFYWIEQRQNKVCFAAVDCTGHGVPGALMSVVGFNLLTQAVNEVGLTKPSDILKHLDAGVTKTLRQSEAGKGVKDGMDLSLCSLDILTNEIQYAGAFNSLYYVRNKELFEVKADKFPIGVNLDGRVDEYSNHSIQLQSGDCVYLFSDGYADQFGGPKGKKFKYNQLKQLLIEISGLPLDQQKLRVENAFDSWKGKLEQVDDVVIIGVRIG